MFSAENPHEWMEWLGFGVLAIVAVILASIAQKSRFSADGFQPINELVVGLAQAPRGLDIENLSSSIDREILGEIHLRLVALDSAGQIYPQAASRWTVSHEGRRYSFHLRDDLSFASGKPFECVDVLHTFQYLAKTRPHWSAMIGGMECESPLDFQVRLKHASAHFLSELGDLSSAIHLAFAPRTPDLDGLGPYAVDGQTFNPADVRLKKREHHPLANPQAPQAMRFRVLPLEQAEPLLARGQMHVFPIRAAETSAPMLLSPRREHVWMLVLSPRLLAQSPALVACLNEKLDRKAIAGELGDASLIETSTFAPLSETTSITASAELSDLDGCARVYRGKLRVMTGNRDAERMAQPLSAELNRLGLKAQALQTALPEDFEKMLGSREFDLALMAQPVTASPYADLAYFYTPSEEFKPSQWVDKITVKLAHRLRLARNEIEAKDLAQTLAGRALKSGPFVPLFFENAHFLTAKCVRLADSEKLALDRSFAAFAREKNCLD